jgi:formylglycine-generating enzyme required for sulfatase activity
MRLYDEGEKRWRRWTAPAVISVRTEPAGAAVMLYRYVEDARRKLREERVRELGRTPIERVVLPQGSYLFTLEMAGRAPVRYPVLLGRAEELEVKIDLVPASAVPKGFVYVPAGRFLFGSAADEEARRGFFSTAPMHEVWTEGFLIARTEVTFGDWIEYLRELSPRERAARTPNVGQRVLGGLRLEHLGGERWRLVLQPTERTFVARAGEPLRYPERTRNRTQDWLRFPVVAVSAHDAYAYAAWLGRTRRVRGARLCTEHEWERAARGADDRIFPHGFRLDPEDANYDETYGKKPLTMGPDAVGSHPASRSPFGLLDTSGNAWEWALSSLHPGQFVARCGGYIYSTKTNQIVNRTVAVPTLRDNNLGLRVCATPGSLSTRD